MSIRGAAVATYPSLDAVKRETASLRALLDAIERATPSSDERETAADVVEELARLGCRLLEAAAELAAVVDPAPAERSASGVRLVRADA